MLHGQATPRLPIHDPKAARISELSEEYLSADAARKHEIGEEVCALMARKVVPMVRPAPVTGG
jgi:hypothetical protein